MQVKSSQLPQPRALVNPHSGCASISIHTARGAKDLIRANRNQPPRTSGSIPLSAWRVLPLAALGLLCGQLPAVLAQAAPVRGGYVHITPSSATIAQGGTLQLRSAVLTPLGFQLPNRTVTWKSSNAAIAGVSNTGLVTAVAPGAVTITAKSGAALGTATVNVSGAPPNTAPVVTITAPADGATFEVATSKNHVCHPYWFCA
jgi:hypothetical protein